MNAISLLTVTHNSSSILESFLATLNEGGLPGDEVIIVDSGSDDIDSTRAIASAHGARLLELRQNVGYGVGTNLGAEIAVNQWLAIVNPDVETTFAGLRTLVGVADSRNIACLGPSIATPDGAPVSVVRGTIRPPWRRTASRISTRGSETASDSISGCCMVIRKSDFLEANGFDPYFFMFAEEIDLHKRLWEAGKTVATTSAVTVITAGGGSSSSASARWAATERDVAHVRYIRKHFSALEAAIDLLWRYTLIARKGVYKPRRASLSQLTRGVFSGRPAGHALPSSQLGRSS